MRTAVLPPARHAHISLCHLVILQAIARKVPLLRQLSLSRAQAECHPSGEIREPLFLIL